MSVDIVASLKQRLFRWKSDGTKPLRLNQRRIFILPTGAGLLFATVLIVMLVSAINYALSLGHALVFLLAGMGFVGMVHTFRNLHGLLITPGRCEPVFAGEIAHFQITLDNDRSTARQALELEAESGKTVIAAVNPKKCTNIAIPVSANRRGWLELPRIRLSSRYPLGFFVAWSYPHPAMRCLVYPKPVSSPLPAPLSSLEGGEQRGEAGQEDFSGFRERQPADSPRHVAWKASARNTNEHPLLIKQFAGGAQAELQLDWLLTDPAFSVEKRLSLLAGWVLAAESETCIYGLRLPSREIAPGNGETHRQRCLEALALFQA